MKTIWLGCGNNGYDVLLKDVDIGMAGTAVACQPDTCCERSWLTPLPVRIVKLGYLKEKMKLFVKTLVLSAGLLLSVHGFAETSTTTPPAKPAASAPAPAVTKGVMVANPVAPGVTGTTATQAPKPAKSTNQIPAAAAGGGDGKVWVNAKSKVYHCAGTKYYGKTKAGEYMSEADAKAKGNHANNKKACS